MRKQRKAATKAKPVEQKIDLKTGEQFAKKIDLPLALRLRLRDGLTHEQIAERFGCTKQAVSLTFERFACLTENPEQLEAYRANKLGVFETVEQALIERLLRETAHGRCSVGDLARAIDVIGKHVRLLAGQSTANIGLLVQTLGEVHKDVIGAVKSVTDQAVDAEVLEKIDEESVHASPVPEGVS